jgi:hypothetical protein
MLTAILSWLRLMGSNAAQNPSQSESCKSNSFPPPYLCEGGSKVDCPQCNTPLTLGWKPSPPPSMESAAQQSPSSAGKDRPDCAQLISTITEILARLTSSLSPSLAKYRPLLVTLGALTAGGYVSSMCQEISWPLMSLLLYLCCQCSHLTRLAERNSKLILDIRDTRLPMVEARVASLASQQQVTPAHLAAGSARVQ